MNTYLIWSHEHRAWWGPNFNGYTEDAKRAGRYDRASAIEVCKNALPGSGSVPNEIPVLEEDLISAGIIPKALVD